MKQAQSFWKASGSKCANVCYYQMISSLHQEPSIVRICLSQLKVTTNQRLKSKQIILSQLLPCKPIKRCLVVSLFWRVLILSINHFLSLWHMNTRHTPIKKIESLGHIDKDSMFCSWRKNSPTSYRAEAESSSDGEEKQISDWTTGTDGTDDLDNEWYSGNLQHLNLILLSHSLLHSTVCNFIIVLSLFAFLHLTLLILRTHLSIKLNLASYFMSEGSHL